MAPPTCTPEKVDGITPERAVVQAPVKKKQRRARQYDPILTANPHRFTMFPIKHSDIWAMYKKAEASTWTVQEIDLAQDIEDWQKLNADEHHFIKHVLAFFAASDGVVIENLIMNVMTDVQVPEARAFYGFQTHIENVHSEMYSLLIDTFVKSTAEKTRLFTAIDTIPMIEKKALWCQKWIKDGACNFGAKLAAFACVEGIMFSSSFAAIFWLKTKGLMPGLCLSNEFIARDEGLHTDFAVLIFHKLHPANRPDSGAVTAIVKEATELEKQFAVEALPVRLMGLNAGVMSQYIEFVADRLLNQLGCATVYGAKNPLKFMDMISIDGKTNFFERGVSEYQKTSNGDGVKNSFVLNEDF